MYLNTISPAENSKPARRRVGRGIGSGIGKTCGRGHKGQTSRTGGYRKVGFEGGQMPIQRRLPKVGFHSWRSKLTKELTLNAINLLTAELVDLQALRDAGVINGAIKFVKIIRTGTLTRPVTIQGLGVTAGAKEAIIAAGGKVEE